MKVVLDARWIFPEISGIGAYTRELLRALAERYTRDEFVWLFDSAELRDRTLEETGMREAAHVKTELLSYGVFSPRGQFLLPSRLRKLRPDIYHSTNYLFPLPGFPRDRRGAIACVATVHDVIPMIFPDHAPRSRKSRLFFVYKRLMEEVGRRADAILADSEASRRDILTHLRISSTSADRVHVVPCGISSFFKPSPTPPREKGPDEPRRLLYVGRSDPYKNIACAIRALAEIRRRAPFPVTLTLAGSIDPRYPEAPFLAAKLGLRDVVHWTGYLSDEALLELYRTSDVLVHPSRYEGFGLQVAEAMACGLPVVCSNAGSLPEVAGDAAVLLDPDDTEGFAAAILEILTHPEKADRLREKGFRQARIFTWTRTAETTYAVYRKVLESPASRS